MADKTMYDIIKVLASEAFNYPDVQMCSDGDMITFLKDTRREDKVIMERSSGREDVVRSEGWFYTTYDYQVSIFKRN